MAKFTLEEAKRRVIEKHGKNTFDLSGITEYTGQTQKLILQCPTNEHEDFSKDWEHLWRGQGCPRCSNSPSFDDLTGKQFGELIVLKRGKDIIRKTKGIRTTWICYCSCGNTKTIAGDKLKRKKYPQTTCGHTQEFNDLSNKLFGKLKVTESYRRTNDGVQWFCKCECQQCEDWYRSDHLLSGATTQCHWCKREATRKARLIDLTGLKFGKLTVIRLANDAWGQKKLRWICSCDCSNDKEFEVSGNGLRAGKSKSCGCTKGGWDSVARFRNEPDLANSPCYFYFVDVRNLCQKFGIAKDILLRGKKNMPKGKQNYTKIHVSHLLKRAEAWAVEQACLLHTDKYWQPAYFKKHGIASWDGWTECRVGIDIETYIKFSNILIKEVKKLGWETFLKKYANSVIPSD